MQEDGSVLYGYPKAHSRVYDAEADRAFIQESGKLPRRNSKKKGSLWDQLDTAIKAALGLPSPHDYGYEFDKHVQKVQKELRKPKYMYRMRRSSPEASMAELEYSFRHGDSAPPLAYPLTLPSTTALNKINSLGDLTHWPAASTPGSKSGKRSATPEQDFLDEAVILNLLEEVLSIGRSSLDTKSTTRSSNETMGPSGKRTSKSGKALTKAKVADWLEAANMGKMPIPKSHSKRNKSASKTQQVQTMIAKAPKMPKPSPAAPRSSPTRIGEMPMPRPFKLNAKVSSDGGKESKSNSNSKPASKPKANRPQTVKEAAEARHRLAMEMAKSLVYMPFVSYAQFKAGSSTPTNTPPLQPVPKASKVKKSLGSKLSKMPAKSQPRKVPAPSTAKTSLAPLAPDGSGQAAKTPRNSANSSKKSTSTQTPSSSKTPKRSGNPGVGSWNSAIRQYGSPWKIQADSMGQKNWSKNQPPNGTELAKAMRDLSAWNMKARQTSTHPVRDENNIRKFSLMTANGSKSSSPYVPKLNR